MNEKLLELIEELEIATGTFRANIFDPNQEAYTVYAAAISARSTLDSFIAWYKGDN